MFPTHLILGLYFILLVSSQSLDISSISSGSCIKNNDKIIYLGGVKGQVNKNQDNQNNDKILTLDLTKQFNVSSVPWQSLASSNNFPKRVYSKSIFMSNSDTIINFGGSNSQPLYQTFDLKALKWSSNKEASKQFLDIMKKGKRSSPEDTFGFTLLQNDQNPDEFIYYGSAAAKVPKKEIFTAKILIYNIKSEKWSEIYSDNTPALDHISIVYGGKLYSFFGTDTRTLKNNEEVRIFDLKSKKMTVSKTSSPPPKVEKYSYTKVNDQLYVIPHTKEMNSNIYILNLKDKDLKWSKQTISNFKSNQQGCFVDYYGYLLFFSGETDNSISSAQIINPQTWKLMDALSISSDRSNNNENPHDSSISNSTEENRSNLGAIVGGIVGGIMFLVLAGLGIYFFIYRKKSMEHNESMDSDRQLIQEPKIVPLPESFDNSVLNCSYSTIATFSTHTEHPFKTADSSPLPAAYLAQNIN
ncbi:hypothetical protein K502DRAFT_326206 [Neoconidiobolus thromboides FSU 785]|nr:hypothetical protein K502DRAFT_326206 [Neoconidiobolus thromboides FSU 785]